MNHGIVRHVVVMLLVVLLAGCNGAEEDQKKGAAPPGDGQVLARVNGSAITQDELDQAIRDTLGGPSGKMLDNSGRLKMLESLVSARAIAQTQEKTLDERQKSEVERKTAAYREQLLVKMYLAQNTQAEPVTQEMVKAYYEKHPEQFGARAIRTYELISSEAGMSDAARDQLLTVLAKPGELGDWPSVVADLRQKGLPVQYRKASSDARMLAPELGELISRLEQGQCSGPMFINMIFHALRVLDIKHIPARPLGEVSADIRRQLLPVQLKKAVKRASEKVLEEAKVEYLHKPVQDRKE